MFKSRKSLLILAIIILFSILFYLIYNNSINNTAYPNIEINNISKEEYSKALELYSLNPVMNGQEKVINLSDSNDYNYYSIRIKDKGYNKKLPIDVEVFLSTDSEGKFLKDNYFIVSEPKDLNSKKLQFLNTLVFVDEFGNVNNNIIISLKINTVYNKKEQYDFEYRKTILVDLLKLEVI